MPIVLQTSDMQTFEVGEEVALQSVTIRNMIEDDCAADKIPLPNVDSKTLAKVIEFCKRHADVAAGNEEASSLQAFDKHFVDSMENHQQMLFDTILAANYLNIKELLDLTCKKVADMMKGKTPEEIRTKFNIKNDFTKEEEAEVRRENAWAFE